jgi:allantoinase
MRTLVIRSTRVLLPSGLAAASLHVSGDRIARITGHDDDSISPDVELHDVGSLAVMPGIVDTHVHLNDPGRADWEGFETGTAAATAGGVTTLVDMPLNSIPATTTVAALEAKRAAARGRMHVDLEFWGGVVPGNQPELAPLCDAGVRGFKCFLVPSGVDEFPAVDENDLRQSLPILAERGVPLLVHAEWPSDIRPISAAAVPDKYQTWLESRPPHAEIHAVQTLIALCREFRSPIHIVHLSASGALPLLRQAKADGLPITAETCPHYLTLCAEDIADGATEFKCAPPIRDRANGAALWRALDDGTIDAIATDHSPCPPSMKPPGDFVRAWGGISSLELSLALVWTEAAARHVAIDRISQWMCAATTRLAGLARRKGTLAEGMQADITIWDPEADFVVEPGRLFQRHKLTPYARRRLRGRIRETYVGGRLVYRDGTLLNDVETHPSR